MQKKTALFLSALVVIGSAHAAMWTLVNQQFVVNKWYCTYKLEGSSPQITKTIESSAPCQPAIFVN